MKWDGLNWWNGHEFERSGKLSPLRCTTCGAHYEDYSHFGWSCQEYQELQANFREVEPCHNETQPKDR